MDHQQEAFGVRPMLVVPVAGEQPSAYTSGQNRGRQEAKGPLKQIIDQQDSLYKYINWEDPVKTFGFYVGIMSVLFGAHYLPLTRYALKMASMGLGAVCVAEYAGRVFSPNTFLARLRPREYKQVPESTLNATLKDVHDFVQHLAVQVQKVMWGEDLSNTFVTFLALTSLYWLAKILSPFGLLILGVHALFIAPLITSPRGREVTQDFVNAASNTASAAADKGTALAQQGQAKAQQLTSQASEATRNAGQRGQELADSGRQTAVDLMNQAKDTTSNVTQRRGQTTQTREYEGSDLADEMKREFPNTSDSLNHDTSKPLGEVMVPSEISSGVPNIPSTRAESFGDTLGNFGDHYTHTSGTSFDTLDQGNTSIMDRGPPLSHETLTTPRQMAPPPLPTRKPVHVAEFAEEKKGYSNPIFQ